MREYPDRSEQELTDIVLGLIYGLAKLRLNADDVVSVLVTALGAAAASSNGSLEAVQLGVRSAMAHYRDPDLLAAIMALVSSGYSDAEGVPLQVAHADEFPSGPGVVN
jgi:hypothetical protein